MCVYLPCANPTQLTHHPFTAATPSALCLDDRRFSRGASTSAPASILTSTLPLWAQMGGLGTGRPPPLRGGSGGGGGAAGGSRGEVHPSPVDGLARLSRDDCRRDLALPSGDGGLGRGWLRWLVGLLLGCCSSTGVSVLSTIIMLASCDTQAAAAISSLHDARRGGLGGGEGGRGRAGSCCCCCCWCLVRMGGGCGPGGGGGAVSSMVLSCAAWPP